AHGVGRRARQQLVRRSEEGRPEQRHDHRQRDQSVHRPCYPRKGVSSLGSSVPKRLCACTASASSSATTVASTTTSVSVSACTTGSTAREPGGISAKIGAAAPLR